MKSSELKHGAVYLGHANSSSDHLKMLDGTIRRKWSVRQVKRIIPPANGDGGWIVYLQWSFPWIKVRGFDTTLGEVVDIYAQVPVTFSFAKRGIKIVRLSAFATWAREEVKDFALDEFGMLELPWVSTSMPASPEFDEFMNGRYFGEDIKEIVADSRLK